jgi:hypothetical protein
VLKSPIVRDDAVFETDLGKQKKRPFAEVKEKEVEGRKSRK